MVGATGSSIRVVSTRGDAVGRCTLRARTPRATLPAPREKNDRRPPDQSLRLLADEEAGLSVADVPVEALVEPGESGRTTSPVGRTPDSRAARLRATRPATESWVITGSMPIAEGDVATPGEEPLETLLSVRSARGSSSVERPSSGFGAPERGERMTVSLTTERAMVGWPPTGESPMALSARSTSSESEAGDGIDWVIPGEATSESSRLPRRGTTSLVESEVVTSAVKSETMPGSVSASRPAATLPATFPATLFVVRRAIGAAALGFASGRTLELSTGRSTGFSTGRSDAAAPERVP